MPLFALSWGEQCNVIKWARAETDCTLALVHSLAQHSRWLQTPLSFSKQRTFHTTHKKAEQIFYHKRNPWSAIFFTCRFSARRRLLKNTSVPRCICKRRVSWWWLQHFFLRLCALLRLFRVRADLRMRCFALNKHSSADVITSQSLFFSHLLQNAGRCALGFHFSLLRCCFAIELNGARCNIKLK